MTQLKREESEIRDSRRQIAVIAAALLGFAILGWIARPNLYPLWVFLICFSVATVPRWLRNRYRARRK